PGQGLGRLAHAGIQRARTLDGRADPCIERAERRAVVLAHLAAQQIERLDAGMREQAEALARRWARLGDVTRQLSAIGDPQTRLANASVYLEAFGHLVVAWLWHDGDF
ncbi:acyl-CoA dehydrogenase C-terminal domain-containing protein, partial [Burkholderia cenocepacia]|uniref:acyl-CoA dehydrogenase C-terminal domain-containing protein n=1 Tax=Burkholderia cenocepacia TaxID=95486 RepID=UPI0024B815A5